jgi:peptidoglycan/LPS O-acetylase OafA/YrhL
MSSTPRIRLAGIDGLRAAAACSIVLYHCWLFGTPGRPLGSGGVGARFMAQLASGVTLFFALSGFLLYRPIAAAVIRGTPLPSVRGYLRNRALRILPAYWAVLLLAALAGAVVVRYDTGAVLGTLNPAVLQDAVLVQNTHPATLGTGIPPAWSLAVEAAFYLSLPCLGLLAYRIARTTGRGHMAALVPALLLLVIGLIGKATATWLIPAHVHGTFTDGWHSVLDRSFLAQADKFSLGMALAVLRVDAEDGRLRVPPIRYRLMLELAAIGMVLALLIASPYWPYSYDVLMTMVLSAVVGFVAVPVRTSSRLLGTLESRWFVAAGVASYSIFLWNQPVEYWLRVNHLTAGGVTGMALNIAVLAILVGCLATLSYRYVERPALRRKTRSAQPVVAATAVPALD